MIKANVMTLDTLFKQPLAIPDYQRPYAWKDVDVKNFLKSITHAARAGSRLLLGTVIVHKHETQSEEEPIQLWNIVDGQQRLVTLYILAKSIEASEGVCETIGMSSFAHGESQTNIRVNHKVIKNWLERQDSAQHEKIKELLKKRTDFIVVTAPTLDDAFIFFNSQNNRGKRLSEYDLVKANHLRFIEQDDLQRVCATSWERIERAGAEEPNKDSGTCTPTMKYLMQGILGRVRQCALNRGCSLLEDFRCQRSEPRNANYYYFSNYAQPPVFTQWRFDHKAHLLEGGGLELILKHIDAEQGTRRLRFVTDSKRYLPFQIPQSIEGGEQFFWFVEKYHAVYHDLFVAPLPTLPTAFSDMMRMTREIGGHYVRKFFEAVMVFYFDKFGCDDAVRFMQTALYLQFVVFDLQSKQRVQERSIPKFIRDSNPFAWVHEASTPGYIMAKVREGIDERQWYRNTSKENPAKKCRARIRTFYASLSTQTDQIADLAKQLMDIVPSDS
jgi:hypothetical protein